eukprot:2657290-Amphidinium_carterae.1
MGKQKLKNDRFFGNSFFFSAFLFPEQRSTRNGIEGSLEPRSCATLSAAQAWQVTTIRTTARK